MAVNRIYYSMFYIISAIALKHDYSTSKHKQLIGWFNKQFISTNRLNKKYSKIIYAAYSNREKSDYDFLFELSLNEVLELYGEANDFIQVVKKELL